jgi:hypothetical protein
MGIRDGNGNYAFRAEMMAGKILNIPYASTTSIPDDLGAGSDSEVMLVDMAQVYLGEGRPLRIDTSREAAWFNGAAVQSAFSQDQTIFRAIEEIDMILRQDAAVAVLIGVTFALTVMVQQVLQVPIAGSVPLFLAAAACYLFSAASIGIFLGTLARSMPQLGLLIILSIIPLMMLSGGVTPRESMPAIVQNIMLAAPATYFVRLAQAILYRGAGFDVIWRDLLAMTGVGAVFFGVALVRFRKAVTQTQV